MKLYIDAIPADGGQRFQSYPAAWQADWNAATNGGKDYNWNSTTGAALAADVHAYYQNIVTTLEGNPNIGKNAVGIVSIGNEINDMFVGVPSGTSLYYELVYKGAAGVKAADPSVAVMLHLHDVNSSQWNLANQLANAHSIYQTPQIDFNVFGLSFHSFDNPLTNPNWKGSHGSSSNGQTIGLVQAFQSENFGQFTNETTNQPDSGTPIYLMVAETEWVWTGTAETVNGTLQHLTYTSSSQFVQDNPGFTFYQLDASGYMFNPCGKTKAARRQIALTASVNTILKRRLESGKAYLFPCDTDDKRPVPKVNNAHDRAVRDSKIAPFRLYDLRHTWATRAAMSGIDLVTLASMLGHSKINMVMRYAHPTQEHQTKAMEKMSLYVAQQQIAAAEQGQQPMAIQ